MTNYEKIKNMSAEKMAEFLADEAYVIWESEQSIDDLGKLNATQLRTVKQFYYNYFYHELLRNEADAFVDNFSCVYKGKSILKELPIEECREIIHKALENNISEKPIRNKVIDTSTTGYKYKSHCPKCSSTVSQYTGNYCPNCGQALDWSEGEK